MHGYANAAVDVGLDERNDGGSSNALSAMAESTGLLPKAGGLTRNPSAQRSLEKGLDMLDKAFSSPKPAPVDKTPAAFLEQLKAATAVLQPPSSIPQSAVASLWRELLTSLLQWLPLVDFSLCGDQYLAKTLDPKTGDEPSVFEQVQRLLREGDTDKFTRETLREMNRSQFTTSQTDEWEVLLLYLLRPRRG